MKNITRLISIFDLSNKIPYLLIYRFLIFFGILNDLLALKWLISREHGGPWLNIARVLNRR